MDPFPDTQNCGLRMRDCLERFPRYHSLAILACITARASCRHRLLAVSFEVGGGKRSRHSRGMRNPEFCVSG